MVGINFCKAISRPTKVMISLWKWNWLPYSGEIFEGSNLARDHVTAIVQSRMGTSVCEMVKIDFRKNEPSEIFPLCVKVEPIILKVGRGSGDIGAFSWSCAWSVGLHVRHHKSMRIVTWFLSFTCVMGGGVWEQGYHHFLGTLPSKVQPPLKFPTDR